MSDRNNSVFLFVWKQVTTRARRITLQFGQFEWSFQRKRQNTSAGVFPGMQLFSFVFFVKIAVLEPTAFRKYFEQLRTQDGIEIVVAITAPDAPAGRGKKCTLLP